jgi:ATP-dependent Lon protease
MRNVMQESATTGFVRPVAADRLMLPLEWISSSICTCTYPGGIPKDGQARSHGLRRRGVAAARLADQPDVGMTGEITLRGNVSPVGGIKEKVFAAHRAGLKRVLILTETSAISRTCPPRFGRTSTSSSSGGWTES